MILHETAEVFSDGEVKLRGVLHWAETVSSSVGMVMCYPFGEERKSAARVMTRAARGLCGAGVSVLRFDYRGTGESDGCIEAVRLQQWVGDIQLARQHLQQRTGASEVGVLGVRFGALLASLLECKHEVLPFLVSWVPLWSGRTCVSEMCRHLAATRLVVSDEHNGRDAFTLCNDNGIDMGGFWLSSTLRSDLEAVELPRDAKAAAETVVIIEFSTKTVVCQANKAVGRKLTCSGEAGRVISVKGRPFWVTASRFDPLQLVDCTVEALRSRKTLRLCLANPGQ